MLYGSDDHGSIASIAVVVAVCARGRTKWNAGLCVEDRGYSTATHEVVTNSSKVIQKQLAWTKGEFINDTCCKNVGSHQKASPVLSDA
jgi:hypothetical protein